MSQTLCPYCGTIPCECDMSPTSQLERTKSRLTAAEKERQIVLLQIRDLEAAAHKRCDELQKERDEAQARVKELYFNKPFDYVDRDIKRIAALENALREAKEATIGMLNNYLVLKRISLSLAKSDAPNWIGRDMTVEDDIHVHAVRKALQTIDALNIE